MDLEQIIQEAYKEDLPTGDLTTDSLNLKGVCDARLVAKEDLVLAGREVYEACARFMAPEAKLNWQFADGDFILKQQTVCWLKGDFAQLLKFERVALNFLGRLSGIATLTRCFVSEARGQCKILDTRKTTPLLRHWEKAAVRAGGGLNHRMNLSAAVLIKENHQRASGGLSASVRALRKKVQGPIEVECSTLDEVKEAVREKVQRILLDNMDNALIQQARTLIPPSIEVEASGNMQLERIASVAALGVDYISVGALTHSAPCADFSLLFDLPKRGALP
jgi:nicotinate-nucleotide pyrophosphorylase (carboxylating)